MIRVEIKPELLSWARERAGYDVDALSYRFPKLTAWERGEVKPTLKQIEKFASATHTPIGFLFLQEPPVEHVPIPDFRTAGNRRTTTPRGLPARGPRFGRPSPDLLDIIYVCQQRQEWYRDFARSERESSLSFVGSVSLNSSVESTAESMRHALNFDIRNAVSCRRGQTRSGVLSMPYVLDANVFIQEDFSLAPWL